MAEVLTATLATAVTALALKVAYNNLPLFQTQITALRRIFPADISQIDDAFLRQCCRRCKSLRPIDRLPDGTYLYYENIVGWMGATLPLTIPATSSVVTDPIGVIRVYNSGGSMTINYSSAIVYPLATLKLRQQERQQQQRKESKGHYKTISSTAAGFDNYSHRFFTFENLTLGIILNEHGKCTDVYVLVPSPF